LKVSFGGVLFDDEGRVLIRRPTGEFDGYVWTFPKGRMEKGTTPEETALKEVREETGYDAKIIGKVPGTFAGGTGSNEYYLMSPVKDPVAPDPAETEEIRWVTSEQAEASIRKTRNAIGRERDLNVLKAAIDAYERLSRTDSC
jgi:8-oxo-dGTP diphosphatase